MAKNLLDTLVLLKSKLDQLLNTKEYTSAVGAIAALIVVGVISFGKWYDKSPSSSITSDREVIQQESHSVDDQSRKVVSVQIDGEQVEAATTESEDKLAQVQTAFNKLFENFPDMLVLDFTLTETRLDRLGISMSVKWSDAFVSDLVDFFEKNYLFKCFEDEFKAPNVLQCRHKSGATFTEQNFFSCAHFSSSCNRPKDEMGTYFIGKGLKKFEIFDSSLSAGADEYNSPNTFYYFEALQVPVCNLRGLFIELTPNDGTKVGDEMILGLTHWVDFQQMLDYGFNSAVGNDTISLANLKVESRETFGGISTEFVTKNTTAIDAELKLKCDSVSGDYRYSLGQTKHSPLVYDSRSSN